MRGMPLGEEKVENLTVFVEEEEIMKSTVDNPTYGEFWDAQRTIPNQNLSTVLSRVYQIDTVTWATASLFGDVLGQYKFPNALFAMPQISQLLTYFQYFRCRGVRIGIRLNSTIMHYGALCLSEIVGGSTNVPEYNDIDGFQMLNNNPHIISAMKQDTVELTIPWTNPVSWIYLPLNVAEDDMIARVSLSVLFPLLADAASATSVTVTVFANFIAPELTGPRSPSFPGLVTPKHGVKINESGLCDWFGTCFGSAEPKDLPELDKEETIPTYEELYAQVFGKKFTSPETDSAAPSSAVFREKWKERSISPTEGKGLKINESRKHPEAQAKMDGVFSDVQETFKAIVEVGELASSFAKVIGPIAALDKPSSGDGPNHMQPIFGRDMPSGRGVDGAVKLSLDPGACIAHDVEALTTGKSDRNIYEIVRTPGFVMQYAMTNASVPGDKLFTLSIDPMNNYRRIVATKEYVYPTYLSWYSSMFKFWRGSLKFHVKFCTSRFTTTRIRAVWTWGATIPATLPNNEVGDIVSRMFDVTGDTDVNFTIPWLHQYLWEDVSITELTPGSTATNPIGWLTFYLVNEIVNGDPNVVPTVYVATWISAGNDFQLNLFTGIPSIATTSVGTATSVSLIQENKSTPMKKNVGIKKNESCIWSDARFDDDPIIETHAFVETGYCAPEVYGDIVELGKRYCVIGNGGVFTLWDTDPTTAQDFTLQSWLAAPFRFMRGSRRFKIFYDPTVASTTPAVWFPSSTDNVVGRPEIANALYVSPVMEFEIPWYSRVPAVQVMSSSYVDKQTFLYSGATVPLSVNARVYQAFGDDVSLIAMYAPPVLIQQ